MNAPEAMSTARRDQLQTWLENRRHGRVGVDVGRTIADALTDLEQVETLRPADGESIATIRRWLEVFCKGTPGSRDPTDQSIHER